MSIGRYLQPETMTALRQALGQMTPGSRVIAGGTDLMIEIKNKAPEIPVLVSLCRVPDLRGIRILDTGEGQVLEIGAMECHADIAASPLVREMASALAESCDHVGSLQVRNRGTIGGSLGNASVAGDMLPVLVLLHATLLVCGPEGAVREMRAEDLPRGVGRTSLSLQEIITAVRIPIRPERKSCFCKLGGREEVTIAEISLSLSWTIREGVIRDVEGVLGAVDVAPIRLTEIDGILGQGEITDEACDCLAGSLSARIREIRRRRKRPPKLRIREGEKEYKERAVRGVVYDAVARMRRKFPAWTDGMDVF